MIVHCVWINSMSCSPGIECLACDVADMLSASPAFFIGCPHASSVVWRSDVP